ncbi:MAG TPA: hypothetical protein VNE59_01470 [Burkholderiales bacterium]|nr:hypothetical protein [Burkholderiales bacterium]
MQSLHEHRSPDRLTAAMNAKGINDFTDEPARRSMSLPISEGGCVKRDRSVSSAPMIGEKHGRKD